MMHKVLRDDVTNYIYQDKMEEEDLLAFKVASIYRFIDKMTWRLHKKWRKTDYSDQKKCT